MSILRRSTSESSFLCDKFPLKPCKSLSPPSIFVANLNSNIDDQTLACDVFDLFSKFGEIYPVKVRRDSLNRPFAFVNFKIAQNIDHLFDKKFHLHCRSLRIERTKNHCTLEIQNVSELHYDSLIEIEQFLLNFGPIQKLNLHGSSLTCTFTCKQNAMNALVVLQENGVNAVLSKPVQGIIWVGNLPNLSFFTESELLQLFSPFGAIVHIQIFHTNCVYAFITFKNIKEAVHALSYDGLQWKSRILHVKLKDSTKQDVYGLCFYPSPASGPFFQSSGKGGGGAREE